VVTWPSSLLLTKVVKAVDKWLFVLQYSEKATKRRCVSEQRLFQV